MKSPTSKESFPRECIDVCSTSLAVGIVSHRSPPTTIKILYHTAILFLMAHQRILSLKDVEDELNNGLLHGGVVGALEEITVGMPFVPHQTNDGVISRQVSNAEFAEFVRKRHNNVTIAAIKGDACLMELACDFFCELANGRMPPKMRDEKF
ncbi:MAG: hypothetical protein JJU11_16780 [Candidatus Sumerlaeia bacterium]|nr:hypothetical protein [Candidatus Sumerlaeia bacterium]